MSFTLAADDPVEAQAPKITREDYARSRGFGAKNPAEAPAKPEAVERQQVGARVTKATYRQLKAKAALSGLTVQTLVEQAIDEFLAKVES